MAEIEKKEIARLTEEYGGAWGMNHTRRLLHLVVLIGEGLEYDADVVWLAAHLHDWGAYPHWAREKDIDHVERSLEVAEAFMDEHGYPEELIAQVLACIASHHQAAAEMSTEALLLREADVLDFLGAVGIARDFSKNHRDLGSGFESLRKRRESLPGTLTLEKSKELAAGRLRQMDQFLDAFRADSFGCY